MVGTGFPSLQGGLVLGEVSHRPVQSTGRKILEAVYRRLRPVLEHDICPSAGLGDKKSRL